ncbi:phosphoribosyltransferase [Pseudomonas sp. BN505]|uniref:phosphoribosyltransferase n=1 Tax=Pseudomonas TaxID=286 RepID=UPI000750EAA6|nr:MULTISPECIES: phosphoribosyltransferase [Pseudomonas]MCE0960436.1 phosphoribosyltransferase [Pseudomonas putida]MCE0972146.1 phosphoribosyltransferase [Pseudomonas putida]MDD2117393.1 phosphoribosyltransferase [Pseudomonas putida]MDH4843554.1 phosphoribosyltransferase [Pseudomonas sp. BN605]MDH4855049.1 phosphoribosyltransferase [Pseudomonas sp. BN505]
MSHDLALPTLFVDRTQAGRCLVEPLARYAGRPDVIVLALPRGGVPVAYEVATALNVRLDLLVVRKLGMPFHPEFAMGAIASGGVTFLNDDMLRAYPVDPAMFDAVVARETEELARRERAYRGGRPALQLKGQVVILIDDGLATGATMRAAIQAARAQSPARIVVAIPVAPPETLEALYGEVDELVCPLVPEQMVSVGYWYQDFPQTSDEEVMTLMGQADQQALSRSAPHD